MPTLRCLYLAHRAPYPPKGGARVRAFHCIRHLHEAGHEVVVGTLTRNAQEQMEVAGLSAHCSKLLSEPVQQWQQILRMIIRLPTREPSTMGYFHTPRLRQRVMEEHAAKPFDLVFCHSSGVAPYAEALAAVPKVMDFVDMDSQKWLLYAKVRRWPLSLGYWLEGKKLEHEEARIARAFDCSMVVSAEEHRILRQLAPTAMTNWVSNGVDIAGFSPSDTGYDPHCISFIGRFDYYPNAQGAVWFCEHVMPRLLERLPQIQFQLVGANPTATVRKLASNPRVLVTGTVPEVQPFVHRSLATVAPLLIARGIQNKVLESMAMGVPAIVSAESAGGVDAEPGVHLLVCTKPEEYVEAIVALTERPEYRQQIADAGRQRAAEYLAWPRVMARMDAVISPLVG